MTNQKRTYFVAGTDTEIGKTTIARGLLYALAQAGLTVVGMKPIAAGAELRHGRWRNDDADALAAQSNVLAPSFLTTPYLLRAPTAPHIAAQAMGVTIQESHILACHKRLVSMADAVVIEGVGGFNVPLSETFDSADLAQSLASPVVLVVGIRLGCINHALLTADAIISRGLYLAGWVANVVDEKIEYRQATIGAIASRIAAPFLGEVPRLAEPLNGNERIAATVASHVKFSSMIGWPTRK